MKHRKLKNSVAVFFSLGVFIPFVAQAEGLIQLPQTGQIQCYSHDGAQIACSATGQDGELQKGVLWPSPRFTSGTGAESECMIDNLTGLMWPKNGNLPNGTKLWDDAIDYSKTVTLCGHSDWRLPNINELESLVNLSQSNVAAWLNNQGFINVQPDFYWSSTTWASDTSNAMGIIMGYGSVTGRHKIYSEYPQYVWPVRSGQSDAFDNAFIWRTGQTVSYRAGDDGDLKRGASWPSPRFNDEGNGEVIDNLTGLVRTKDTNPPGPSACSPTQFRTWQGALDYVKCLNTQNYLGHNDWRLPNRKELRSIFDYSQKGTASLPLGHPFTTVEANFYWSSSTIADTPSKAWYFYMYGGYTSNFFNKDDTLYVWPVRAGQVWPIKTLTISKSGKGNGSVTVDTGTIAWNGNVGKVTYKSGTSVTLIATANAGSTFAGWSGACSEKGICSITLIDNTQITADFSIKGDLNNSGNTDLSDAILGLMILSRIDSAGQTINIGANVTQDKKIGLSELIYILQKVAGLRQD